MCTINGLQLLVETFKFAKQGYSSAEEQLIEFANLYAKLDPGSADQLRASIDSKVRLGLFGTASSLFQHSFPKAAETQRVRLLRIVFAMYSFDNLGFGYDSVRHIIDISKFIREEHELLAKKAWLPFRELTTNQIARNNLENHIFGGIQPPTD